MSNETERYAVLPAKIPQTWLLETPHVLIPVDDARHLAHVMSCICNGIPFMGICSECREIAAKLKGL